MEPRRYTLVPDDTPNPPSPVRRRWSLARVAPSSRSALGVDRLERMEQIAELDRRHDGREPPLGNPDPAARTRGL